MNKQLVLIFTFLAAVTGMIVVTEQLQVVKPQQTAKFELLSLVQKSLVQKIEIASSSNQISFTRTADNYWISETTPPFLVSPSKIAQLLDQLNQAQVQRELENTEAERQQLELNPGTSLKLQAGQEQLNYEFGKTHSNGGPFILAPKLSKKILLLDYTIPVSTASSDWQDLKFLTIAQDQFISMAIRPAPNVGRTAAELSYAKETKKFSIDSLTEQERPKLNDPIFSVVSSTLTSIPLNHAEPLTSEWQARIQAASGSMAQLDFLLTDQTKILIYLHKLPTSDGDDYLLTVQWDDSARPENMTKLGAYFQGYIYRTTQTVYDQVNKGREEFLSLTP